MKTETHPGTHIAVFRELPPLETAVIQQIIDNRFRAIMFGLQEIPNTPDVEFSIIKVQPADAQPIYLVALDTEFAEEAEINSTTNGITVKDTRRIVPKQYRKTHTLTIQNGMIEGSLIINEKGEHQRAGRIEYIENQGINCGIYFLDFAGYDHGDFSEVHTLNVS
jgi:hypothetical protein